MQNRQSTRSPWAKGEQDGAVAAALRNRPAAGFLWRLFPCWGKLAFGLFQLRRMILYWSL